MVNGCTITACRSAKLRAVPELAVPAARFTTVLAPAATGAVPAISANLTEPSGQRFLTVVCAVAPLTAMPLPLGMSPCRNANPTQKGAVNVVAD